MAKTELIEVRKRSWGKSPKEVYLYKATSEGTGAAKPVMVSRESPNQDFIGCFKSMDDFMRILTIQFLKDEIEIVYRVAYENGKLVSNSTPVFP